MRAVGMKNEPAKPTAKSTADQTVLGGEQILAAIQKQAASDCSDRLQGFHGLILARQSQATTGLVCNK